MSFNTEGTVNEPFPKIRIIGIVARLHAVEPLVRFLNDAYDNFSKKAAFAPRKIRSELAIEMLMNRLKNTDYKIV